MMRVVALLVVPVSCSTASVVDTESAMVAWSADRVCKSDDDCVMVDDCCACSAGGGRIGVSANAKTAVEARRKEACSTDDSIASPDARRVVPVKCSSVVHTGGSCAASAHAACRDKLCRIVD